MTSNPAVAIVIPTLGRIEGALRAVRSALKSRPTAGSICVVDLNGDAATTAAIRELAGEDHVRIVRHPACSVAEARNIGARTTAEPVVAFTDDDCEVDPAWAGELAAVFARDPGAAVVFGSVRAAQHDHEGGFIMAYEAKEPKWVPRRSYLRALDGVGASMAVRRSAFERLGGFDELFGVGGPLRAAEDGDLAVRAVAAGFTVRKCPRAKVVHHGLRAWSEGPSVVAGYLFGIGAGQAKALRLGRAHALSPLAALAWRWIVSSPAVELDHRSPRLPRLRAFAGGALKGWNLPLDRATGHFVK